MTRHLCISVTLLDGLFHGKGDGDEPEWPPSPMRLFQALVAGSRMGCRNVEWSEVKSEAFRWLERREPPVIVAPPAERAAAYTLFVPNNDADTKFDRQDRLTRKIVQPHRLAGGESLPSAVDQLHYLWAIPDPEWNEAKSHGELLCCAARHLTALGLGIDQAVADGRVLTDFEVEAISGQRWRAWGALAGRERFRVPKKGSFDDLGRAYEAFVNRLSMTQPPKARELRMFDSVVYLPESVLPHRSYAAFELPEGVAFQQEDAIAIAAMLRSAACRRAKADSHVFPGGSEIYVAGHTNGDASLRNGRTPLRFSYLPLPTIGHDHADGMIRRLMIAEPFGGDGAHARWAQARLRNQILRDKWENERGLLLNLWRRESGGMVMRYVRESKEWSTVTPVILPGFDDRKQVKAERLLLQAIEQADIRLDSISDLVLRSAPFWPGSQHPRLYRRPSYLKHLPAWHVWLRFREAVSGPLSIGAGRHCGLGLFAGV